MCFLQRHIGMALVPPAAFTAVPDSPPPTPLPKYSKKVVASPVIPCMLGATATGTVQFCVCC